jgi:hypothetical protein
MAHTPGPWRITKNGAAGNTFRIWRTDPDANPDNAGYACIASHVNGAGNAALVAAAPDLLEALRRAATLLKATRDFINSNPVQEYMVHYDEADCDGACLADDCRLALDEAEAAIGRTEMRSSQEVS